MEEELKKIKKRYGEGMAKLCRNLFPTLIEKGVLFDILESNFQENRYLSKDIIENKLENKFRDYINSKDEEEYKVNTSTNRTPDELLSMAGYELFECKTEEDIQSFKHYYKPGEELCTFLGGRLENNYVFFAVKKNVYYIKRENFNKPLRQDEYGTSVISIQFCRGGTNHLSIKNRYNSVVKNCDSTFSNNLNNIIEGLSDSFEKEYNLRLLNQKTNFEIPNYVSANNGKFYKYNYKINDIYYCSDNIIIDNGKVIEFDKNKYFLFDYFLMDLENKSVSLYDYRTIFESLIDHLKDIDKIEIKNLDTAKTKKGEKEILITRKDSAKIKLKTNKYNQMISLDSDNIINIEDGFLFENKYLSKISLSSVKNIRGTFLINNQVLSKLSLPSVQKIGNYFAFNNIKLSKVDLPMVKEIGNNFIIANEIIDEVKAPLLERVGTGFLGYNRNLVNLSLPLLKGIGNEGFFNNSSLTNLNLPEIEYIGEESFQNHSLYSKLTCEEIRELSDDYENKELGKQVIIKDKEDDERMM